MEQALEKAVDYFGSRAALARAIGVSPQAITKWRLRVPIERVLCIERATGGVVTRYELRPDMYPEEAAQVRRRAGRRRA